MEVLERLNRAIESVERLLEEQANEETVQELKYKNNSKIIEGTKNGIQNKESNNEDLNSKEIKNKEPNSEEIKNKVKNESNGEESNSEEIKNKESSSEVLTNKVKNESNSKEINSEVLTKKVKNESNSESNNEIHKKEPNSESNSESNSELNSELDNEIHNSDSWPVKYSNNKSTTNTHTGSRSYELPAQIKEASEQGVMAGIWRKKKEETKSSADVGIRMLGNCKEIFGKETSKVFIGEKEETMNKEKLKSIYNKYRKEIEEIRNKEKDGKECIGMIGNMVQQPNNELFSELMVFTAHGKLETDKRFLKLIGKTIKRLSIYDDPLLCRMTMQLAISRKYVKDFIRIRERMDKYNKR